MDAQLQVHADYTDEKIGKPALEVTFVAADKEGAATQPVDTSHFSAKDWTLPYPINNSKQTGDHRGLADGAQMLLTFILRGAWESADSLHRTC